MSRDAEMATAGYAASPRDWHVEPSWADEALIDAEEGMEDWGFGTVWDPSCGRGTIVAAFRDNLYDAHGSDIEYRGCPGPIGHVFDFLEPGVAEQTIRAGHFGPGKRLSIVMNPPYSYEDGIAEAFVRRALGLATVKVCALLPIKWQASEGRHTLFTEHVPSRIWVLSERPSMPPGALVAELGDKAFKRGKVDYMWVVWDVQNPATVTEWRTIAPRPKAARKAVAK